MQQYLKSLPIISTILLIGCASNMQPSQSEQIYLSSATNSLRINQPSIALESANQVIKQNSNSYQAYYLQAQAYQQLGESTSAANSYEQALKINPSNVEIIDSYATLLCSSQSYSAAELQYAKAYQLGQKYNQGWEKVASDHGDCLTNQNKLDLAVESYQVAINSTSKPASAYLGLSYAYIMQQDYIHAAYAIGQYPGDDTPQSLRLKIAAYNGLIKSPSINSKNKSILKSKTAALKTKLSKLEAKANSKTSQKPQPIILTAIPSTTDSNDVIINNTAATKPAQISTNSANNNKMPLNADIAQRYMTTTPTTQSNPQATIPATAVNSSAINAMEFEGRIQKNAAGHHYIIVEPGDTLYNISQQSKISEARITQLNKLKTQNVPLNMHLLLD